MDSILTPVGDCRRYTGLLHDADEGVRAAAVETFPRFAVTVRSPHIPAFSQRLTDSEPSASIRREAIGVFATLTTLERTPCVGPLARMIVGDANTECRATAAAAFTALEPSERTAILGELAGAVLTNKAVDRGIVLEVFGRLPREEQLLHNPTLLKSVLSLLHWNFSRVDFRFLFLFVSQGRRESRVRLITRVGLQIRVGAAAVHRRQL